MQVITFKIKSETIKVFFLLNVTTINSLVMTGDSYMLGLLIAASQLFLLVSVGSRACTSED